MNWILAEDLAREHVDALRRAADDQRRVRAARERRGGWRRGLGTRLVTLGLAVAAGVRAAKAAPDLVAEVIGDGCLAGDCR
jgi:thiamine pyrophosphate-dependent acetolactate synthase large subunit-like protein